MGASFLSVPSFASLPCVPSVVSTVFLPCQPIHPTFSITLFKKYHTPKSEYDDLYDG